MAGHRFSQKTNGRIWFVCREEYFFVTKELTKGQLISKAIYGLLTSPKKQTDEFFYSSRQTNQIRPFVFWENLRLANLLYIGVKYFNLTPQIDPISSMVSKLSITVQFVPIEFLPFSGLVVSFNNTFPACSSRYLKINRCDLYNLSFLSSPISVQQNLVLFENFYPPTHFSSK